MLKTRIKRRSAETARTAARLAAIEASVSALVDDDLLDLADIFSGAKGTPLAEMASAELQRRNLSV